MDIFHPINAFHTLIRASDGLPKLINLTDQYKDVFENPSHMHFEAAQGLANLQEYTNHGHQDMSQGILKADKHSRSFHAHSKLSSEELILIAKAAATNNYLDRTVEWLETALTMAREEKKSKKRIKKIKQMILDAKLN